MRSQIGFLKSKDEEIDKHLEGTDADVASLLRDFNEHRIKMAEDIGRLRYECPLLQERRHAPREPHDQ
jgi:hypothetical protein